MKIGVLADTHIPGQLSTLPEGVRRAFRGLDIILHAGDICQLDVLRALRDVERIVKIEEQALGPQQQALVRFYMLKIARLCGENG